MSTPEQFFVTIGAHRLECDWYPGARPALVLLHEGLGSVSMWKDFPARLAAQTGHGVLVYSRYGYGQSTPCMEQPVGANYMHREALETLPTLLNHLELSAPFLVGHSDGGSIALIHAGGSERAVSGIVTLAAHVFNEEICVSSIEKAKVAFETTALKDRLARYHDDPEGAFRMWNDAWLAPDFRNWNIEEYLPRITSPVLAVQGAEDEYGSIAQLDAIGGSVAGPVETVTLPDCGHSAHKDQPDKVLALIHAFVIAHRPR